MKEYQFGCSFNCCLNDFYEIGGAEDGTTLDYVSDNLEKLIKHVETVDVNFSLTSTTNHDYVGMTTNFGDGVVVAVMLDSDSCVAAVIASNPVIKLPTIVE